MENTPSEFPDSRQLDLNRTRWEGRIVSEGGFVQFSCGWCLKNNVVKNNGGKKMEWTKKGILIKTEDLNANWAASHMQMPTPYRVNADIIRLYFSVRDRDCKSHPVYADINSHNFNILSVHTEPLLELGKTGTFDDCGITFSSCVEFNGKLYMYYIGWNKEAVLPYTLSIGLAISGDGGMTFQKISEGPVMDRDCECPYFNTAPYVLRENDGLRMWYVYCTEWQYNPNDGYVPAYLIRSAFSSDGIHWKRDRGGKLHWV